MVACRVAWCGRSVSDCLEPAVACRSVPFVGVICLACAGRLWGLVCAPGRGPWTVARTLGASLLSALPVAPVGQWWPRLLAVAQDCGVGGPRRPSCCALLPLPAPCVDAVAGEEGCALGAFEVGAHPGWSALGVVGADGLLSPVSAHDPLVGVVASCLLVGVFGGDVSHGS